MAVRGIRFVDILLAILLLRLNRPFSSVKKKTHHTALRPITTSISRVLPMCALRGGDESQRRSTMRGRLQWCHKVVGDAKISGTFTPTLYFAGFIFCPASGRAYLSLSGKYFQVLCQGALPEARCSPLVPLRLAALTT